MGSTSRRNNLRVVGKKWEGCNSSELRHSSWRQQAFLWSPRTIGTLQLLTNKFLKLLHSHTDSDTAHHMLISSSADKELSCQFFPKNVFCRRCYFSSSPFKVKYLVEVPTVQWSSADPKLDKVKLYSLILPRRNLNFSQPLKNSVKSPSLLLTPNLKIWKVL